MKATAVCPEGYKLFADLSGLSTFAVYLCYLLMRRCTVLTNLNNCSVFKVVFTFYTS